MNCFAKENQFAAAILPSGSNFRGLLSFLRVLDNIVQAWVVAQEAVSKRQRMRTGSWTLLHAFGKTRDPYFNYAAILKAPQGF